MRKTTKKLLSSALAGLFVLSSLPLMGAAEAEGNTALAYTPELDGVKDEAYDASYTVKTATSEVSFLYDADYIYVYANIDNAEPVWGLSLVAGDNPYTNFDAFHKLSLNVVSNTNLDGFELRNWSCSVYGSGLNGYQNIGYNLGWQEGYQPEGVTPVMTNTSPTTEYAKVVTESSVILEFRAAYKNVAKGDVLSVSAEDNANAIYNLWANNKYTSFTLGDEYKAEVPDDTSAPVTDTPTEPETDAPVDPPVEDADSALKFTPELDGVKDEAYNTSYSRKIDTKFGSVDFSFLYDDDYIYVYADSVGSSDWDCFTLAMMLTDNPVGNWNGVNAAGDFCSNPHLDGYDLRHWTDVMGTGHKNLGWNIGWQEGKKPADDTMELVDTTPATEYKLVRGDEKGAVLEFRIAYNGITKGDSVSVSMAEGNETWNLLWEGKDYTTFTLGEEYKTETPVDPPESDSETSGETPVDPDPETSTIDGVKDSYYNDENVLTNAAGTLYYAPVKTDGVPELHCYIEVPAAAKTVSFHLLNEDSTAFWNGSATMNINVEAATGAYVYIWGGNNEDIHTGEAGSTDIKKVAVKAIDGDKVAIEFAVPSSEIASGKEYMAAFGVDADGIIDWQEVYNSGNISAGKGTKIVLGKLVDPSGETPVDPPAPDANVIKKGTPVLDGKLDSKYLDSAVYKTLDAAKAGNIALYGWINPELNKLKELTTNGALKVKGPNQYEIGENVDLFAHAEIYFLWDDDALYIFSKVYDDSIFEVSEETVNNMVNNNINDTPWTNDSIAHVINFDGIPLQNFGIGHLNPQGTAGGYGVFDRSGMGYSTIGTFMTAEGNENVCGTVGDGFYTVEMRIPTTDKDDTIKDLLKDGGSFSYDYWLYDIDDEGMAENSWYQHANWMHTMSAESVKYTLSDVAAKGEDPDPDESTTETPTPVVPEENIVKKGTPVLDGALDGKYLKSAVYRTIDSAKAGKSEFGAWVNPLGAKKKALVTAGVISIDNKMTVTEESNFGVSAFAKSETYFLWDDDALYIFSTVYDEDPIALTGDVAAALNGGPVTHLNWQDDNIMHRIATKSGVADILANAGGELIADNRINSAENFEKTVLTSLLGYYRNENSENVRGIVESDRYTIEMRIPLLDSVKADVLKDGAEIGYGYRIMDGDSGFTTGNSEQTWLSIQNQGFDAGRTATTLVLSADLAEDPEVTTDPDVSSSDPDVSDTNEPPTDTPAPDVSDTNEPPTDTPEPDESDTNEPPTDTADPDVSDTDEPTPDNLGDVNGDGVVNSKDLVRLMRHIAGDTTVEIVGKADINNDGKVNSKDLVALMKLIAAKEA